jgi:type I restriction enzyme S subunit
MNMQYKSVDANSSVPAGWDVVPLAQVAFFQEGPGLRKWQWTDSGMKVINVTNILGDGQIDTANTRRFISMEEFSKTYSHFSVDDGDIVIASSGNTYGKTGRISAKDLPLMMNTSVIRFHSGNAQLLNDDFLYAFLRSEVFRNQVESFVTGSAQPNFGPSHLKQMVMPLPPLSTQRRIAGILTAYDDLIENNQRRIRILEDMARSLYREWFVNFRYTGHESVPFVDSPLGQIPQGWAVNKLSDIAVVNRTQINAKTAPDELHYIDIASVSPGQIDYVTTYAFADAPGRARRVVQHGDVLWSCVRPNRRSHALVIHPEANTIASTGFAVLSAKVVPFTFLYFATTTDDFVSYLTNNASGAAYPAVTATTFEKAELLIPPSELLERFGEATIAMTEQAHILQRQTANLRRTRDLLLPRLLSGQVTLATDPSPIYNEDEFKRMVEKGTQTWAGVPDSAAWVETLRGNKE